MVSEKNRPLDIYLITTARLAGSASLLLFGLFLLFGAWSVIELHLSRANALLWNAALSFLFFIQHSGMVRRGLSTRLSAIVPGHYHRTLYTIVSGAVLTGVVVFWQPSPARLLELHGVLRWVARCIFLLGLAGFAWGTRSLPSFDAFGKSDIMTHRSGQEPAPQPFSITGPYRWIRHPLYFFSLLLIWSSPDVTADRLLFNVLWSTWICVGAFLEERDLAAAFGDRYRSYQHAVPMLIPWKGPVDIKAL